MRDILIILSVCLAAIILGAWLFFYGSNSFSDTKAQQQAAPLTADVTPIDISFSVLDSGEHALGVSERKNVAVYGTKELPRLQKMAHGTDGEPLPGVDFTKNYVIGVFAGTKPVGGYAISVGKITEVGDTRTVDITLTKPGANCVVTEAQTSPYQLIVVPFSSASLTPNETTVETSC